MRTFAKVTIRLLLGAGFLWIVPAEGEAQSERFSSTTGLAVTTGDYGTGEDTTITQLYETLMFHGDAGEVGVVVPYLIRSGGGVTAGETTRAKGGAIPDDANGLGDVQLKGKYFWLKDPEGEGGVDLAGRIKLPAASKEDGLGTGGVDVGFGPGVWKRFGSLVAFGDLELVLRDKPSGSSIRSTRVDYAVGVGHPMGERFTAYVSLEGGTPSSSGAKAPLELVTSGVYRISETVSLKGFLLAGLSEGSPDFGAGTAVTVRF